MNPFNTLTNNIKDSFGKFANYVGGDSPTQKRYQQTPKPLSGLLQDVYSILSKYQQSPVGQDHTKAGSWLAKRLITNPVEFGKQMGGDIQELGSYARNIPTGGMPLQIRPEKFSHVKDQLKRVFETGALLGTVANPMATAKSLAGLTAFDAALPGSDGGLPFNFGKDLATSIQNRNLDFSNTRKSGEGVLGRIPQNFERAAFYGQLSNPLGDKIAKSLGMGRVGTAGITGGMNVAEDYATWAAGLTDKPTARSNISGFLTPFLIDRITGKEVGDKAKEGFDYYKNLSPEEQQRGSFTPGAKVGDDLIEEARKYKSAEEFVDAKVFRDAHASPTFDDTPIKKRMEEGGDFNLLEVVKGQHNQPKDYFDTNGPRYYSYNDQEGMESSTAIDNIKRAFNSGNLDGKTITAYRVVPNDVNVDKLIDGDWISFSKQYALNHGDSRFGDGAYKIIKQEVSPKDVWWDGNDIREWGYDTGKTKHLSRSELKDIWNKANQLTSTVMKPQEYQFVREPIFEREPMPKGDLTPKEIATSKLADIKRKMVSFENEGRYPPTNMKDKRVWDRLVNESYRILSNLKD